MNTTAKNLRFKTKELLDSVTRGEEITITFRGKPLAKLIPIKKNKRKTENKNELFGIWKDRSDLRNIDKYVRNLRKGRFNDND